MAAELHLEVRRSRPKHRRVQAEQSPTVVLSLRLYRREGRTRKTLADLSAVPITQKGKGPSRILPTDRARAWEELARWIIYLVIIPDPVVQEGHHQNRLKAEDWAHGHGEQPTEDELYDWRTDQATLERLRPRYAAVMQKMCDVIGRSKQADFNAIYPNRYEDDWLSDRARQALRDLRALFGSDILAKE